MAHRTKACLLFGIIFCFTEIYFLFDINWSLDDTFIKLFHTNHTNCNTVKCIHNTFITNNHYDGIPCSMPTNITNNSYKSIKCKKDYSNIISVFGTYCNELSIFWFHRLLYAMTISSTKVSRYIFIFVHNLNGTECINHNKNAKLYRIFVDYLTLYFDENVHILLFLENELFSSSETRNYLTQKISNFFNLSTDKNDTIRNIQKVRNRFKEFNGEIIVSFIDGDDIPHPLRIEYLDHLYRNRRINGSVLHAFSHVYCRNYYQGWKQNINITNHSLLFNAYFNNLSSLYHDVNIFDTESTLKIYKYMQEFHSNQAAFMLEKYPWNLKMLDAGDNIIRFSKQNISDIKRPVLWSRAWNIAGVKLAHGWPTTTLNALLANPFQPMRRGEDTQFEMKTINASFDVYLSRYNLGHYCIDGIKNKIRK